jgi:DNA-binding transcriptional regulator YdaS (Cro superfamily)
MTPQQAIDRALEEFDGNLAALAAAIGFSQPAFWQAIKRGKLSAEMANNVEVATKGAVTRQQLRPDLFSPKARLAVSAWNGKRKAG